MVQQIKLFATKPDDLSSLGLTWRKERTNSWKLFFELHVDTMVDMRSVAHKPTTIYIQVNHVIF